MHEVVRKTLQIYLRERRVLGHSDFPQDDLSYLNEKNAVFVTLYFGGKVIASQGFAENLKNPDLLDQINIRVDTFAPSSRRILRNISELNVRDEGIIFLSQNLGKLSVILPNMIKENPTSEAYFELAKQKAGISAELTNADYVIYALKTTVSSDF